MRRFQSRRLICCNWIESRRNYFVQGLQWLFNNRENWLEPSTQSLHHRYQVSSIGFELKWSNPNQYFNVPSAWIRFSPKKSYLAVGSSDNSIDFYEWSSKEKMNRVAYCTQVPGNVLQMDWSTSATYIKVNFTIISNRFLSSFLYVLTCSRFAQATTRQLFTKCQVAIK